MNLPAEEQLLFKPYKEVLEIARAGWPVHVFVNPVAYHGPHLALGTDRLLSERIARRLHERLSTQSIMQGEGRIPFIVGGHIDFGVDPCPGRGSVGLSYGQLRQLVLKQAEELAMLNIRKVIYHTFHSSPFHNQAIHAGIDYLDLHGVKALNVFDLVIQMIVDFDESRYAPLRDCFKQAEDFRRVLDSLPDDYHAGFFETSVALHLAPESVSPVYRQLPPCPELKGKAWLAHVADGLQSVWKDSHDLVRGAKALEWMALKPFPGYTGMPALASAEAGRFFVEQLILPQYLQATREVLWHSGEVPQTPFAWSRPLSYLVGGRV